MISESSLDACDEDAATPQHNNNNVSHAQEKSPSAKGGPPKRPEVSDAVRNLLEQRRSSKEMVEKAALVEAAKAKEKQMVRDDAFLLPLVITSPDARRHSTAADALSCAKQYSKLRLTMPQRDPEGEAAPELSHTDSESELCSNSYPFAKCSPRPTRASWSAACSGYTENTSDNFTEVPHTAPVIASKPDGFRLVGKVNRKLKHCLKVATGWRNDRENSLESDVDFPAPGKSKSHEIKVIDLTSDDLEASPSVHKLTYAEFLALGTS